MSLVAPQTWQAEFGLYSWEKRKEKGLPQQSPLELARATWPDAPLEFEADSGRAVWLPLAKLAVLDRIRRLDRGAMREAALQRAAAVRRNNRLKCKQTILW